MSEKKNTISALSIALEFGYTIAIPIVVLALAGRLLDNRLDTSPWFLIGGIILSMVISSIALVKKFTKILAQIEAEAKQDANKNTSPKEQNEK